MRKKTYSSSSSSSSDDEVLISLKKEKDSNGYQSLCDPSYQCCEFCDDVFTNRYDLIKHKITHVIIPLTKLMEPCKICFQHFAPGDELESHMLTHKNLQNNLNKNDINKVTPDILKKQLEKQVLVKCELDINALMTLSQNNVSTTDKITNGHTESQIVKSKTKKSDVALQIKSELTCHKTDLTCTRSDLTCQQNDMEIFNVDVLENVVKKEKDLVKEEPLSPPLKERASSPFDEDKESIRQRLIFEEDIEDTLFKNPSSECNVNIDKLCQKVTFDFYDAIPVSNSDDSIGFNKDLYDVPDESDNSEILMHNAVKTENHVIKMNNSDILMDNAIKTMDNVVKMNNSDIGMNNILKQIKSEDVSNVDLKSGIDKTNYSDVNFANAINGFQNGINDITQEEFSKRLVILDVVEKVTVEVDFKPSTHYDDLMFPEISNCRYYKQEFPNREEKLIELKKELKRKRNCERQRAYYHRQKDLKKNEEKNKKNEEKKKKKLPKTNAERQREFRHRQRELRQRNAEKSYVDILWWKRDLKISTSKHESILKTILQKYIPGEIVQVCSTCYTSLEKEKIPFMSTYNGFAYPKIPSHLPTLNLIEQRLISPRIPFMQIRRLRHVNGQYGIYGHINVPVEVNTMVKHLPRNIEDDHCFYVHLKKKLIHKTSFHGLINKSHIKEWLSYLVSTPLYIYHDIKIDESFFTGNECTSQLNMDEICDR